MMCFYYIPRAELQSLTGGHSISLLSSWPKASSYYFQRSASKDPQFGVNDHFQCLLVVGDGSFPWLWHGLQINQRDDVKWMNWSKEFSFYPSTMRSDSTIPLKSWQGQCSRILYAIGLKLGIHYTGKDPFIYSTSPMNNCKKVLTPVGFWHPNNNSVGGTTVIAKPSDLILLKSVHT